MWYWTPPFLLMLLIFYLSSRTSVSVADTYAINFIVFKSLHLIEYGVLFFLLFRALHRTYPGKQKNLLFALAIVFSILYAISDELHQTAVPTRNGSVRDVAIDTLGILLAFSYTKINYHKIQWML